jgi:hypothetical protein
LIEKRITFAVVEGEEGVGMGGDEGSPWDNVWRWDSVEEVDGVGQEVGFGVEGDELVVDRAVGVAGFDGLGMGYAWFGVAWDRV